MINGKTKVLGLLGWPVEHTLSPVIQNAAFQAVGLNYVYVPLPVKSDQLAKALAGLQAMGFAGVNVTVPHKVNVMSSLEHIDRSAQLVGAVNTIVFSPQGAVGYNTDMAGFVQSLLAQDVDTSGKQAVLIGAGGAARAVACGLLDAGAAAITIGARDEVKAKAFASSLAQDGSIVGCGWNQVHFNTALAHCDILINCTPIGMWPHNEEDVPLDWTSVNSQAVVCDLIYNPVVTRFLAQADRLGHKTVGGIGMLVEQGAVAFRLWTGCEPPKAVMYQAFSQGLSHQGG